MAEIPPERAPPLIAGRFEVEAQLGRGGMAAVYRVRDVQTGQRHALKRVIFVAVSYINGLVEATFGNDRAGACRYRD